MAEEFGQDFEAKDMSETSDTSTPDSPKPETTEPKRRWYQYSLRSLLLVMFLFCILFAWGGYKVRRVERQKAAVAWVEEKGGMVLYDYNFDDDGEYIPNTKPFGPDWLRNLIGIDYFCNVERVEWLYLKTEDDEITPLQSLPYLKWITLYDVSPSNQELRKLQEALPHCEIYYIDFSDSNAIWCKQCNDWNYSNSDPHSPEP